MTNEQQRQAHISIHIAHNKLRSVASGQDPLAQSLMERREMADWQLCYLLNNLIPALPQDLRAEVQACYQLRTEVWSDEYRQAYRAAQKETSPICLQASDSF